MDLRELEGAVDSRAHGCSHEERERFAASRGTALLLVGNAFFKDDGWYDIRLHRFASAFRNLGFDPLVCCRSYPEATRRSGRYRGIRYLRVLFREPAPPAEETAPQPWNGEPAVLAEAIAASTHQEMSGSDQQARGTPGSSALVIETERSLAAPWSDKPFALRLARRVAGIGYRAVRRTASMARRTASRARRRVVAPIYRAPRWMAARVSSRYLHYLNLRFLRAASCALADTSPAFVYAADLNTLLAGYRLSHRFGVPLLYDSHEYFLSRPEHRWMSPAARACDRLLCSVLERRYLPRAAAVISVSDGIIEAFRRRIPSGNYICIRNLPFREPPGTRDVIRERLGLPSTTRIALHIGFLTAGRSLRQIVESARRLPEDIAIVFLGGGRLEEETRFLAERSGLAKKVFFLGHVPQEQVIDHARSADCGLCLIEGTCLSYHHSLPNKLFQYVAAGLPVVCSDFPDMAAIVAGRDLGVTVDPSDPALIAEAITAVVGDPDARARMSANCTRAADTDLNWETEVRKLEQLSFLRAGSS